VTGSSHITTHWTSDIGASNASDDLAVYGTGGAVLIDNYGTIRGRIDLATAGDTDHPNVVNNYSNNSWTFTGHSDFGAGLADVYNNTGTVHNLSGTPGNADVSYYDNLEYFTNGGLGYYDTGTIDLEDGTTNDAIYVTPSATATLNYYGYDGKSFLNVDTYLADSGTSAADRMKIDGNVGGSTGVVVNDIGGTGAYNPNGVTVVDVTGDASVANFYLANGPITKGLWDYDMFLNAGNASGSYGDGSSDACDGTDNCYVIASYANVTAYNIASLAAIGQNAWYRTADSWIDRSGDLREYQLSGGAGSGPTGPMSMASGASKENGIWGRIIGVDGGRDQMTTVYPFPNQAVSFDTGYDDTLWGFQGGIDHSFATNGGGTMVLGLMGGYYENKVAFNSGHTAHLTGPTVGVYANWINGGMYVDALLKADFLSAQFDGQNDWTSGTSFGGQIEAGNRIRMANNTFIEPVASLAYVNTSFDSVDFYGTDVSFKNGDSLRGKIGARFGADWTNGNAKVSPYVGAFLGNEFMGDNTVLLESSGPDLTLHDDVSGIFGEVNAGVNIANLAGNATVFAQGSYIFGGDYTAGVGTGGVRFQW
jgi:outer membrane autotransporter protein